MRGIIQVGVCFKFRGLTDPKSRLTRKNRNAESFDMVRVAGMICRSGEGKKVKLIIRRDKKQRKKKNKKLPRTVASAPYDSSAIGIVDSGIMYSRACTYNKAVRIQRIYIYALAPRVHEQNCKNVCDGLHEYRFVAILKNLERVIS